MKPILGGILTLALSSPAWSADGTDTVFRQAQLLSQKAVPSAPEVSGSPVPQEFDASDAVGLRNFHKVSDGIYRSGRFKKHELEKLYDLRFKTILDLEGGRVYRKEREMLDQIEKERKRGRKTDRHIDSEDISLTSIHGPDFKKIDRVLAAMSDPTRHPILVHCRLGDDRTGIVVAAYRIEIEHVGVDAAVQEAKSLHCCHFTLIGGHALKNFLIRYHRYRLKPAIHQRKEFAQAEGKSFL